MKIYVRKLVAHDITHEVSVTTEIVNEFFGGSNSFTMIGMKSNKSGLVTINSVTDPRFGGYFKSLLREEGDVSEGDIVVIYKYSKHYKVEVIGQNNPKYNAIKEVTSEDIRHSILYSENNEAIVETADFAIEADENIIEKYKKYYLENIDEIKNTELTDGIALREAFVKEYPLDRIKSLSLEEYVLGTPNSSESLSYKMEFGKYSKTGLGIGGGSAAKHGIYLAKDGKYHGYKDKEIEKPEEFWLEFRNQLYSYLLELGTSNEFPNIKIKYPLLENTPLILVKYSFMYFPHKFMNVGSRGKLRTILDVFEQEIDDERISAKVSYMMSSYLKENIPELKNDDPQWIGHTMWRFIDKLENEEATEEVEEIIEYEKYNKDDFLKEVFISEEKYDDMVALLERKKNIILTGAPGVGKTFMAKRLAYSLIGTQNKERVELIQFHQSYSYEEFIEGYRPIADGGFKLEEGLFRRFCKKASADSSNSYYLIIDEINRGNLSKIFGELLMLIEGDKRGDKLTLAYSKTPFSVPKNLFIIGLMNTADRSLAIIDYALRRRFSFINIEPAYSSQKFKDKFVEIYDELYEDVLQLISDLNEDIKLDPSLGEGFMVGHSYFCVSKEDGTKSTKEDIKQVLNYEIKPLIEEYWYDDNNMLEKWRKRINDYINS